MMMYPSLPGGTLSAILGDTRESMWVSDGCGSARAGMFIVDDSGRSVVLVTLSEESVGVVGSSAAEVDGLKWSLSKVYVLYELAAFVRVDSMVRAAGVSGPGGSAGERAYCVVSSRECAGRGAHDMVMFESAVCGTVDETVCGSTVLDATAAN